MTREEAIDILVGVIAANSEEENEALAMAIEALKREDHDGCDGCRYEANYELSLPCVGCKQNYVDKYVPMPEHDRDWIVGCIKHDGFVKTDRGDNANQIILDALSADRPKGEWIDTGNDKEHLHPLSARWYRCSVCGLETNAKTNYCFDCGADMRSE